MKVMLRKLGQTYEIYVPKKDLEEKVIEMEKDTPWGGWIKLANGGPSPCPTCRRTPSCRSRWKPANSAAERRTSHARLPRVAAGRTRR